MDASGGYTPQNLTRRQHDVLKLIVRGLSNKEIASILNLAEGTVKILTAKECLQSAEGCLALAHKTKKLDTRAGDAPDFVELGEAGIAMDDAMRRQRRVQLVG